MDLQLRRDNLIRRLPALGVDALFVTRLPNVRYLTGFSGSNGQLLLTARGQTPSGSTAPFDPNGPPPYDPNDPSTFPGATGSTNFIPPAASRTLPVNGNATSASPPANVAPAPAPPVVPGRPWMPAPPVRRVPLTPAPGR